jgi:hypothetical protein
MKLCIDCKYFRYPSTLHLDTSEYGTCAYGLVPSPVTGKPTLKSQSFIYCITLRQSRDAKDCGAKGQFFECGRFLEDSETRCGDEGRRCEICEEEAMKEHAWMRGKSQGACTGVLSEEEKQELRDAGRGHLVSP